MKFLDDGPDIPDELLVARDNGNVLFFCGAGVSMGFAGLSGFHTLAEKVVDELGSASDSLARRLLAGSNLSGGQKAAAPIDRIFSYLDQEFERAEVRDAVAAALAPKSKPNMLRAHRALVDLCKGIDGRPRLVTTNFDLLFEKCGPAGKPLRNWGPPSLPLPERPADFEGVIHLHGRVAPKYAGMSDDEVVLSSSDFGKAYLSDGWATDYIRRLMEHFKIVFVGYSAEDPPVQYLLEALRDERATVSNMYAFERGTAAKANDQWAHKGVKPIAFGPEFSMLWASLEAWAERARDIDGWYDKVFAAAATGPVGSNAVTRGKMAHVVSTMDGSARLAKADPAIPRSWLYVLDPSVRYMDPGKIAPMDPNSAFFDPFDNFRLYSDEAPPPYDPDNPYDRRQMPATAWNAFVPNVVDTSGLGIAGASGLYAPGQIGNRIWPLVAWFIGGMDQAPSLWWAAGLNHLNPAVIDHLRHRLRYFVQEAEVARYWRYLIAAWDARRTEVTQWAIEVKERVDRDGWSRATVRESIQISAPYISVQRSYRGVPPVDGLAVPSDFLRLDVEYRDHHQDFEYGDEHIALAVECWRELLLRAEDLETEIGAYIMLDTTRPDDGKSLRDNAYGLTGPVVEFTHLVETLEAAKPELARQEFKSWRHLPGQVFLRLRIWGAGRSTLATADEAFEIFSGLDGEAFWYSDHRRDLVYALRDRWADLAPEQRAALEERILRGTVPHWDTEKDPASLDAVYRLDRIHWLASQGVTFIFDPEAEKAKLIEIAPEWKERYADEAVEPRVGEVRSILTDTDPTSILDLPIDEVLPLNLEEPGWREFVERDPFSGYSAVRPRRALLAITSAMRRQVQTAAYWSAFLNATSEMDLGPRLEWLVARTVTHLPAEELPRAWYGLVRWLSHRAERMESGDTAGFDLIWDAVLAAANTQPSSYKEKPDRDWPFESINAVVGQLVLALFKGNPGDKGVPEKWLDRLQQALEVPGEHGRHALHVAARQVRWLYYNAKDWTEQQVLARIGDPGPDADAFWTGFTRRGNVPYRDLFARLRDQILVRVNEGKKDSAMLGAYLLVGWSSVGAPSSVWDMALRDVLIKGSTDLHRSILHDLGRFASENDDWRAEVIPFLNRVWPKQRALRTATSSSLLVELASQLPADFASIIAAVDRRLVPLEPGHHVHLRSQVSEFDRAGLTALVAVLGRLLTSDPSQWPYGTKSIIKDIQDHPEAPAGAALDNLVQRAAKVQF